MQQVETNLGKVVSSGRFASSTLGVILANRPMLVLPQLESLGVSKAQILPTDEIGIRFFRMISGNGGFLWLEKILQHVDITPSFGHCLGEGMVNHPKQFYDFYIRYFVCVHTNEKMAKK